MPTAAFENPVSVNFTVKSNHDLSRLQDLVSQLDPKRSELGYQSADVTVGAQKYLVRVQGEKAEIFTATGNEHMEVAKIRIRKDETPEVNTDVRSAKRINQLYTQTVAEIIDALTIKANKTAFTEIYNAVRSNDPQYNANQKGQVTNQTYSINTEDYGTVRVQLSEVGSLHLSTARDSFVLNTDGTKEHQHFAADGKLRKRIPRSEKITSDDLISAIKRTLSDTISLKEASLPSVESAAPTALSENTPASSAPGTSAATAQEFAAVPREPSETTSNIGAVVASDPTTQEVTAAPTAEMQKLLDLARQVLEKGQTSDAVRFTNAAGEPMTLTKNADGSFSFQPPTGSPVKITATGIEGTLPAKIVEDFLTDAQSPQAIITVVTPKAVSAANAEVNAEAETAPRINFKEAVKLHITNINEIVKSLVPHDSDSHYRKVSVSIENPSGPFKENSRFSIETKGSITYINDAQGSMLMRVDNGKITTPSSPTLTATDWYKLLADITASLTVTASIKQNTNSTLVMTRKYGIVAASIDEQSRLVLEIPGVKYEYNDDGRKPNMYSNTRFHPTATELKEAVVEAFLNKSTASTPAVAAQGAIIDSAAIAASTSVAEVAATTPATTPDAIITPAPLPIEPAQVDSMPAGLAKGAIIDPAPTPPTPPDAIITPDPLATEPAQVDRKPADLAQGVIIDPAAIAASTPVVEVAAPTPPTPAAEPDNSLKTKIAGLMSQVFDELRRIQNNFDGRFFTTLSVSGTPTRYFSSECDNQAKFTVEDTANMKSEFLTPETATIHGIPSDKFLEDALKDLRSLPSAGDNASIDPEATLPGGDVESAETEPKASTSTPPALPIDVESEVEAAPQKRGFFTQARELATKIWKRYF